MRADIAYGDMLDLLEERPMTAKAIAAELLAPWQTIQSMLNRAERRGHVIHATPSPDHPVVRYALSEGERSSRIRRLRRTVLQRSVHRQELTRMGALGTHAMVRARR